MDFDQKSRPDYLPLLNTLAIHERNSGVSLKAWADKTPSPELRACLSLVAARETSHYEVFARRIEELGYALEEEKEAGHEERLRVRGSDMSDIEKARWPSPRQPIIKPDYKEFFITLETAVSDEGTDPLTRSLLRWFADEEADSANLLAEAYGQVEAQAK